MKKLAVFFGGLGYTLEKPLFYYLISKYKKLGYEIKKMEYHIPREGRQMEEYILLLAQDIEAQWQLVDTAAYDDIVFVSKSMGTVLAGMIGETVTEARQIFLTPIAQTLQYLRKENHTELVVFGTADPYLSAETTRAHCEKENIPFLEFNDANHSLETDDLHTSLEIMKQVIEACR